MAAKISFCVTSCNRWYQLGRTIDNHLAHLGRHELVVVNYGSRDDTHAGMRAYRHEMAVGRLKYFHTPDPRGFHMAKAKNLAHRLAGNEFLFNLDGDNFLSEEFV